MIPDDWSKEIEADLRRDAATWDAVPSENTSDRFRAAMAGSRSGSAPRSPIVLGPVFAIALLSLVAWGVWGGATVPDAPRSQPLEHELGALVEDVQALADAVWHRVSVPLRRLGI